MPVPCALHTGSTQGVGRIFDSLLLRVFLTHPGRRSTQTIKNVTLTFLHIVWKTILVEGALLIVVTILWRWTIWHTTTIYGFALFTVGGILVAIGLVGLATRGSSDDIRLMESEMEMRSWDRKGNRRFISSYAESTQLMRWMIGLGLVTISIGTILNNYIP